jgi:hypothetical protein
MFCRFPEICLVSANTPDCEIGIIATNTRGVKSDQRGGYGYAYGIVGDQVPRAPQPQWAGFEAEENPQVAELLD